MRDSPVTLCLDDLPGKLRVPVPGPPEKSQSHIAPYCAITVELGLRTVKRQSRRFTTGERGVASRKTVKGEQEAERRAADCQTREPKSGQVTSLLMLHSINGRISVKLR